MSVLTSSGRTLRRGYAAFAATAAFLVTMTACGDSSTGLHDTDVVDGHVHVRVVNGLFQGDDPFVATPVAIDYLIDSATTYGELDIPAVGLWNASVGNRFRELPAGLHNFVARVNGDTRPDNSVYTTPAGGAYLPKQQLIANGYYTLIVAGIVPSTGVASETAVSWVALQDDIYPGPKVDGVYQARFRFINAAPYTSETGSGATVSAILTPGDAPPDDIAIYQPFAAAIYRYASSYVHANAGTYVLTLYVPNTGGGGGGKGARLPVLDDIPVRAQKGPPPAVGGGTIVAQQVVTFHAGEVRTFVLQSTTAGSPSVANHVLTSIVDHTYGPQ
jgi:hypothetical protein